MLINQAQGTWEGSFKTGRGTMKPGHASEIPFSLGTRFEGKAGSNPDEVIGAALAGCFSMALTLALEEAGMTPVSVRTSARVLVDKEGDGFAIKRIELSNETRATGGDEAKFRAIAEDAKKGCPVSKALRAVEITLEAKLVS